MRRAILLGLMTIIASPCCATKHEAISQVTVAQLEQALTAAEGAHKSDDAIARQIGSSELSERLTEATLERLRSNLKAGGKAALALQLLADRSAFLDPPVNELPATPALDFLSQLRLLQAARIYVAQTLSHLPNFLATRTENRFDDSSRRAFHKVGTSSVEVSTRNDRENTATDQMASWGEFGGMLTLVLKDVDHGAVAWSHWEQTPAGLAAVFHYSVPKSASHFQVNVPVPAPLADREPAQDVGRFGNSAGVKQPGRTASSIVRVEPGYRGSLWLNPATGAVLRITMDANPDDVAPYGRASMMVQYGPARIGDGVFTWLVRSLSLLELSTRAKAEFASGQNCLVGISGQVPDCDHGDVSPSDAPTKWLNETLFTGYHLFVSTIRILTDAEATH